MLDLRLLLDMVPRQEDPERGALADFAVDIDEAAGLLDDAVDGGEAEAGALADFLGREERLEDLVADLGRDAGTGVGDVDPHVVGDRHALIGRLRRLFGGDVGGAHGELAAIRHGVARIDGEVHDHLLELRDVNLDRP
jgi:hypothetical protein